MKTSWKRMLSLLLVAAMVLSFGATGYAAEVDEDIVVVDPEEETDDVLLVDEIQAAAEGKVWVGGVEITEDNASDVLGDGKVSYDFETNTLSFAAQKPTFSGLHNDAVIDAENIDLTIEAPNGLSFMNKTAKIGINVQGGALTVNGNLSIDLRASSVTACIYDDFGLTVNGNLTLSDYGCEGAFGVKSMNGPVTVNGTTDIMAQETGIYCGKGDVTVTGGDYCYFATDSEATLGFCPAAAIYTRDGGVYLESFAFDFGVAAYMIYANGPIVVKSDVSVDNTSGLAGGYGFYSKSGGILCEGNVTMVTGNGSVCLNSCDAPEGITIKGDATLTNGFSSVSLAAISAAGGPINVGGNLKVTGYGVDAVSAKGDITVGGYADIAAKTYNVNDRCTDIMRSAEGSINISGYLKGSSSGDGVYAFKDIRVGGDATISVSIQTEREYILMAETGEVTVGGVLTTKGLAPASVCAGTDITVEKDVTITNAAEDAVGILADGKISFVSGKWDVSAGTAALRAKDGIEIPEGFCVTTPVCGTVNKVGDYDTVTEFDGSTVAAHAVIEAGEHEWNEPSYAWAEDNSSVTATRVCKTNENHTETETVETTAVTKDASCEEDGETTYTATFENPAFETQTKTVVIGALGHTPGEAVRENEVAATCENEGSYDEVVYCTVCQKELSRETKTVPALGHDWAEKTYEWAEDNSVCTARTHCKRDDSHYLDIPVKTTYEVITAPTTETEGLGRYTAVFEAPFETQTKDVVIEKLPAEGFRITIEDLKTNATVTGIDEESLYVGTVSFTVSSTNDQAVLVAVKKTAAEDDTFELVKCTTDEEGNHSFTIEVTEDTTVALAFRGDANLNGKLETRDATLICQVKNGAYSNRGNLSSFAADVNNNGKVETRDATLLSQARNNNYTISW